MDDVTAHHLKLVYSAVYTYLGLISKSEYGRLEKLFDEHTRTFSGHLGLRSESVLSKLVGILTRELESFDKSLLLEKWHWLCRDSSDGFVLLYLRQYDSIYKAVTRIAQALTFYITQINPKLELKRGELYYLIDEPDSAYISQIKNGKAMIVGHDKEGRPVIDVRAKVHHPNDQSKEALRRLVSVLFELSYICQSSNMNGTVIIFDLTDWNKAQMDHEAVDFIVEYSKILPTLHKVYIHNAPRFFGAIWHVINKTLGNWLRKKIVFSYSIDELLEQIPLDQLPRHYGGKSRYDCTQWTPPRPTDDRLTVMEMEKARMQRSRNAVLEKFEQETIAWILGSDDKEARNRASDEVSASYWKLDPYVRSRTIWDRHNILGSFRSELASGGVAQPYCQCRRPAHRPSISIKHFYLPQQEGQMSPPRAF